MIRPIHVGLLGIGTVGGGTFAVLRRNQEEITPASRSRDHAQGRRGQRLGARADHRRRKPPQVTDDAFAVVRKSRDRYRGRVDRRDQGRERPDHAGDRQRQARGHGEQGIARPAWHRDFLCRAEEGRHGGFRSGGGGGIPIIKALREGLTANRIEWIAGIINGTSNFILSEMRDKGVSFEEVLKEAQKRGYAEADPTFDIEGIDAAHKLTIMSAIAFGIPMQFSKAYTEGISKLTRWDIRYAEELGYRIKLLGITRRTPKGIELRVHPTLIPTRRLIANVEGVMNAVLVKGDAVGQTLYYGAGAGAEPTASAVVADLVDVTRMHTADPENRVPHLAFQPDALSDTPILPMEEVETAYYLRLRVLDRPGVLADITRILADLSISIDAMVQKEPGEGEEQVDIIMLTHRTVEKHINTAIRRIEQLPTNAGKVTRIRLEELRPE